MQHLIKDSKHFQLMVKYFNASLESQIEATQVKRLLEQETTPCIPSRNKREGKFAAGQVMEMEYVEGWGSAAYLLSSEKKRYSNKQICITQYGEEIK